MQASCQCGKLTATIDDGAAPMVVACHCIDCQKRTGSPFGSMAYYPRDTPFHAVSVLFGFLAAVTRKNELTPAVVIRPQRQTVLVAKQAAEIEMAVCVHADPVGGRRMHDKRQRAGGSPCGWSGRHPRGHDRRPGLPAPGALGLRAEPPPLAGDARDHGRLRAGPRRRA